jgi:hypothetical protein
MPKCKRKNRSRVFHFSQRKHSIDAANLNWQALANLA